MQMQDPKVAKNCHLGTIAQLCRAISLQLRHVSTVGKTLLNSNISPTCPYNMVNFGPLAAEIRWRVWGTTVNFNGFRVLARHSSSGRQPNCGVEQRAQPIFGRAAITLDFGPHSSSGSFSVNLSVVVACSRLTCRGLFAYVTQLSFATSRMRRRCVSSSALRVVSTARRDRKPVGKVTFYDLGNLSAKTSVIRLGFELHCVSKNFPHLNSL